ncbi:Flp family type IVb pilin [Oceanimonas baumannii]|uniref:Flp family type IVb pilin n=1 Tax=Oceanimonas baumannii TaxID=129578 RepID=UPI001D17FCF1|nr:Flp family type IVb pilin [Oceanimonas baumannii]MCC4264660.1 Flp family type IVb pilin [Oceanimonas baumannii]
MNNTLLKAYVYCKLKATDIVRKEDGASAIEYGIIAGLIAVGIIAAAGDVGTELTTLFTTIKDTLGKAKP